MESLGGVSVENSALLVAFMGAKYKDQGEALKKLQVRKNQSIQITY